METKKLQQLKQLRNEMTRFMMTYKFGLDEMNTKLQILKEEFQHIHDYNPIEHMKSRLKSPESILNKIYQKNIELSLDSIKENIRDIAGIRIVCSFISDIYKVSEMIEQQEDVTVINIKDYINKPKPNGYQSLHLLLSIPVFLSDRVEQVFVEIQIRTVAMDFWASLEHKIYYKYNKEVPDDLTKELKYAANVASELDYRMEKLHSEIKSIKDDNDEENLSVLQLNNEKFHLPSMFLESLLKDQK
ncbi:GTP pyrophosphokinase family protein [Paucisalibacillus sp. EB02]|uniref:GTP pyrophosphokinase n=1 Tax=Paucisalibacillus sp. EB02 TaxID=1347087 RepID=UPI001E388EE1|nr:GTP pyrophosphokinase family protein [Paucisalibacillus sp. EB02]